MLVILQLYRKWLASEEGEVEHELPSPYMVLPFIILLAMIATGPLFYHHFWERNYPKIALFLGAITVVYYLVFLNDTHSLRHTAAEYLSFIALLSSLFVASGGILIKVDKKATPMLNSIITSFWSCYCKYNWYNRRFYAVDKTIHQIEQRPHKTFSYYLFHFYG